MKKKKINTDKRHIVLLKAFISCIMEILMDLMILSKTGP